MILSVRNITKSYGERTVLDNVSFTIEQGEKVAFVGANGAGKSTLFKIISGELSPENGGVSFSKSASISYLAQSSGFESGLTLYEEMLTSFADVIRAEETMRALEARMGASPAELERISREYNDALHFFEQNDGYSYKSIARGVLTGLGLDASRKGCELSGGQKTRAALASALLKKPDLLLLDEPTNHLDISSMSWLENYLKSYPKTVLFISHDRYFIDSLAARVLEIENGRITPYGGGYTEYMARKLINFEAAEKRYTDNLREIGRMRESARLLKSYNRQKTVKRAESIEKRIAKAEVIEKPRESDKISFSLTPKTESGRDVLSASDMSKSYGNLRLFESICLEIKKEEKVALIGGNGIGKTTLLKIITGALPPDNGKIRLGSNVKIGLYDQERRNLDERKTVIEHIHDAYPSLTDGEIRDTLAAFLFKGDDVYKSVSALSGGEKGRVCLAEIMLSGANFLILDEPTNDLDMLSREILENALMRYTGTLLCVSHDRYFINKVAERVLELTDGGLNDFPGDYDYYIRKKAENEYYEIDESLNTVSQKEPPKKAKSEWLERKAENAAERRKNSALRRTEAQIEFTETEIEKCDELLCSPEVFSDYEKAKETHEKKLILEAKLEGLYEEWEKISEGYVEE